MFLNKRNPRLKRMVSRSKQSCFRLISVSLGLVIALSLGECLVRLFDLPPKLLPPLLDVEEMLYSQDDPYFTLSKNPVLKFEYRPNYSGSESFKGDDHRGFHINSDGFRDHFHTKQKPAGIIRIVVLGDSITAGNGISKVENTYSKKLQRLLNADPGTSRFEVLNLGVGGYNIVQEIELLRVKGLSYDPDIVLIGFCINDLGVADGNVMQKLQELEKQRSSAIRENKFWNSSSVQRWVLSNSRLALFSYARFHQPEPHTFHYTLPLPDRSDPIEESIAQLARMQEKQAFQSYLFIIPAFDHRFSDYRYDYIHKQVFEFSKRHTWMKVIDLLPDFQEINDDGPVFSIDSIHPNELGHETLAVLIHKHLTE